MRALVPIGLALSALLLGPGCGPGGGGSPRLCNGSEVLCARTYDQVAYATSHNGMSNEDEGWTAPNHLHGLERQLADGVRASMLDLHWWDEQVMLCHGFCAVQGVSIGQRPLVDALAAIGAFLRAHPDEIYTIIFESYADAADVAAAFEQAQVTDLLYSHDPDRGFPRLDEMIDAGTRLVILTDREAGQPAWYHDLWALAFETDWEAAAPEDFSCAMRRGQPDNPLFILNHFITDPLADREQAAVVNAYEFLLTRARACATERGHPANFVTVDFYSIGDLIAVVAELNR